MVRANGPWTILETTEEYRDEFMTVYRDEVRRPDGQPGVYATVRMKPGVCILPIEENGSVYLTRQFRYALGKESLEAVAGGLDEGSPLENARKELREELGLLAGEWTELGQIELDTSMVRCPLHLFTARKLTQTESDQEGTEQIAPARMMLAEAVEKVLDGTITHAPSCVLILRAALAAEGRPGATSQVSE